MFGSDTVVQYSSELSGIRAYNTSNISYDVFAGKYFVQFSVSKTDPLDDGKTSEDNIYFDIDNQGVIMVRVFSFCTFTFCFMLWFGAGRIRGPNLGLAYFSTFFTMKCVIK